MQIIVINIEQEFDTFWATGLIGSISISVSAYSLKELKQRVESQIMAHIMDGDVDILYNDAQILYSIV